MLIKFSKTYYYFGYYHISGKHQTLITYEENYHIRITIIINYYLLSK
jgi:hypothetical protein